jgi:hypothetical protein
VPQSKRHPARRPEKRPAKANHRPRPTAAPQPAREISAYRRTLEIFSAGPLAVLNNLPGWLVPVVLGIFLVAGLAWQSPWSSVFLVVVGLFLLWLLLLAWPILDTKGRLMRVVVVALVFAAAVLRTMSLL